MDGTQTIDAAMVDFPEGMREQIKAGAAEAVARGERAKARHAAEVELGRLRDRLRGSDDTIGELVARLRSGDAGTLSAADVTLAADALEAESLHVMLADLRDLDPFPADGAAGLLTIPASQMPAFTERDVPRLRKVIAAEDGSR